MGVVDILIVVAVIAAFVACVRYQLAGKSDGCADCASGASCSAHKAGSGDCVAAKRMLSEMEGNLDATLAQSSPATENPAPPTH